MSVACRTLEFVVNVSIPYRVAWGKYDGGMELLSGMQPTFVAGRLGAFRILVRGVPSVI